jgi:hypothetical protein
MSTSLDDVVAERLVDGVLAARTGSKEPRRSGTRPGAPRPCSRPRSRCNLSSGGRAGGWWRDDRPSGTASPGRSASGDCPRCRPARRPACIRVSRTPPRRTDTLTQSPSTRRSSPPPAASAARLCWDQGPSPSRDGPAAAAATTQPSEGETPYGLIASVQASPSASRQREASHFEECTTAPQAAAS